MTGFASGRDRFRAAMVAVADGVPGSLQALNAEFVSSLLAFGSETEDNLSCVDRVGIEQIPRTQGSDVVGLALRSSNALVSEVVNSAEGSAVPEAVIAAFPGIHQEDWDAALRVVTMILVSLESAADEDRASG